MGKPTRQRSVADAGRPITPVVPKQAADYYQRGVFFSKKGDYLRAAKAFEHAVSIHHGYIEAWRELGRVHAKLGNKVKAAQPFNQIFKLNLEDEGAWYELGQLFMFWREYPAAIKFFERARQHFPKRPDIWSDLHDAYYFSGKHAEAERVRKDLTALIPKKRLQQEPKPLMVLKPSQAKAELMAIKQTQEAALYRQWQPYPWEHPLVKLRKRKELHTTLWDAAIHATKQQRKAANKELAETAAVMLGLLLSRVRGGDDEALEYVLRVLPSAVTDLNKDLDNWLCGPDYFKYARQMCEWPVNMTRLQGKTDEQRAMLDDLGLGDGMLFNYSPANKVDWRDPFTNMARELVEYVAESQAAYLRWKAKRSQAAPKVPIPAWVLKVKNLPPFNTNTLVEWKPVVREVFWQVYPDLAHIPSELVSTIRSRKSRATSDGLVYNTIIDVIHKRMDSIAPDPAVVSS